MNNFYFYDLLSSRYNGNIDILPKKCKECIFKCDSKCTKFHNSIKEELNMQYCHNGFGVLKIGNNLFIGLTPIGCDGIKRAKKNKENVSNFVILSEEKLVSLINDFDNLNNDYSHFSSCIHDLNNIAVYFNQMEFDLKKDLPELCEENENIKSLIELYNMVKYRLQLEGKLNEAGFRRVSIKIHSLLLKLIKIMSFKASAKNVSFSLESSEAVIKGNENSYLLFFTLFDNAIKYAYQDGKINIYYKKDDKDFTVYIENYGPELSDDEIDKITLRGYRGKNSSTSGNGIGLATFKEICDKSGFKYNFKCVRIGNNRGVFTASVTFPLVED